MCVFDVNRLGLRELPGGFHNLRGLLQSAREYSLLRLFEIKHALPALEQGTDIPEAVWVAI